MKVTFGNPKVTVVSNKVIYKLPYTLNFSYDEGNKEVRKLTNLLLPAIAKTLGFKLSGTAVGVTYCHDNDTYEEILGRRIAESKAKKKVYKYATRVFSQVGYYITKCAVSLTADWQKHEDLWDKEMTHFNQLSGYTE